MTGLLCPSFSDKTPSIQLDFGQIAAEIHFRPEIVERCIHETLLFFAGALRDNKEVEFCFKGIGILAVRRKAVSMTFFEDCLLELDATGNMLAALLGVSLSFCWGCYSWRCPQSFLQAAFSWLPPPASPPGLDTL